MSAALGWLRIALVASTASVAVALPSSPSSGGRAVTSSCTAAAFRQVTGSSSSHGFTEAQCADGWALAAASAGRSATLGLFRLEAGAWTAVVSTALSNDDGPNELATTAISPGLLQALARPFAVRFRQLADAGALGLELARHEAARGANAAFQASPVVDRTKDTWFVVAGADGPIASASARAASSPYPDGTVRVYRWSAAGWDEQAAVSGWMGPIGGCCGIVPVVLAGSSDPDFAMTGGGAADTDWLSILSDIGGRWHLVPFDYGYLDTTVVNGQPLGHGVMTEVDATSTAGGPTTLLFERYESGLFEPASPSGPPPPCSEMALQIAADPGELAVLRFTRFACADGWAMAIGTGAGFTGQVVGLFEAVKSHWIAIELDNGNSLGSDPGIYDIPLSLLDRLTRGFGSAVRPALATAYLIATRAMTGPTGGSYLSGVMSADGADWYVVERPTGSIKNTGADAIVYRLSGSAWQEQGEV